MKSYFIAFSLFFAIAANTNAQITNGNVNYEMRVEQWRQTCDNDALSADDNEVRIGLNSDGNAGGTATWTSGGSGASCGGNNYVRRWQADAPSTNTFSVLMYACNDRINNADFFNITKNSWEEDGAPDCSSSGDACVSNDATNYTFKSAAKTACNWWGFAGTAGVADGWSIGNSILYMRSVWRYTNGTACGSALNFGTLTTGTAKNHVNTNRAAPASASANMGYTNVTGQASPDVFYQFTISSPQVVTITTNNAGTNFDTYLHLYNSGCGTEIAFDDDGVGGGSTTSLISRALCAGTYIIGVEGFSFNSGDFNVSVVANNLTAINGGTIAGIINPTSICVGGDPGAFTSTADASGALTVAAYAYGSSTYQWEQAPTNTFATITNVGTNSTTFDPDATLAVGTYFFRRKVTDACGTVGYSNIIQVNVVADPTAPTNTPTPAAGNVCVGAILSVLASGSTGGAGTCIYEYAIDPGTGTYGAFGATNSITASGTGTYRIKSRRNCNGTGCDISAETTTSWTVVADPTAPTNTPTPAAGNVCVGAVLSVAASGSTGGAGTCIYEYAIDPGTGTYGAFGATNSVTASGTGTYRIKSRRNCDGTGCDISAETTTSWTVVADPTAPTNTPTPNNTDVCLGTTLSIVASGSTGGAGTCIYEYAIDPGTGTYGAYSATNSVNPSGVGSYRIKSRRNCNGTGCDISGETTTTWNVIPQIVAPTLNTPSLVSGTAICQGQDVSATITAGSGGTGASDVYEFSTDGGSTWASYSSGTTITTASATTSVQIRVSRTSGTGSGCNATGPTVIATWPVTIQPTLPTINTATPASGTEICQGDNVSVTINIGTGGTGASDVYEYSTDGGSTWTAGYVSGANITTTSATTSVKVRVSRTAGTGTGCNATATNEITTWPIRTGGTHVILADNTTNGSTLPLECENGGWTYYSDPTDPDKWLFAIEWGTTNATPKGAAVVTIDKLGANIFDEKARTHFGVTRTDASYVMSRFWNVSTSTLTDPVNVRFYYDPAEITSITTQRDAKLTALNTADPGTHFPVSFQWFKTVGAPFSAGLINDGNNFNFNFITLTGSTGTENGITYIQFNGITSFSGGSGGVGISPHTATPLPVTYTSILAKPINNEYIQVSWTTASEINNKGFEVTRSIDGFNFEKIGFVNGYNNSTIAHSYIFEDKNLLKGKEYYYRLNQIDNDGKSEKSSIVSSYLSRNNTTSVGEFYPNPTLQNTTIEVTVNQNTTGFIRLIDALGQEVLKVNNDLVLGLNKMTLNTSSLSAGMYIAYIQIGNEFTQKTIVVNK